MSKDILGVVPGLDFQKRKGSAFIRIFEELERQGRLAGLVDASLPKTFRRALKLRNVASNKHKWNANDQLDVFRYNLTSKRTIKKLEKTTIDFDSIIQIGSNINLSRFTVERNIKCFSFHDNNTYSYIAQLPQDIRSPRRIEAALDFEKRVYSNLSGIFSMSRTLADSFVKDFGVPEAKVHYAGFGSPFESKDFSNKDYSVNRILFIATHSFEKKGGNTLLRAFRKLRSRIPEVELLLVGREWGIEEEGVRVIGFLDKRIKEDLEEYQACFESSSIFVLPSQIEAFGEVFIEAMSYGLPCIGSNQGVMPEIICGNNSGAVIQPDDSDQLSETLFEWISNPSLLRAMGRSGHFAVNNEYTWGNVSRRVLDVIDNSFEG